MRKEIFEENNFYHIYNRGVDKRPIFKSERDRIRFVNTFYILNNFLTIPPRFDFMSLKPDEYLKPIEPYVEVVAGCLMDNHYHFLLTPKRENGISTILHKLGTSYTMYFNKRNERTGRLFEGTFKAKYVDAQEYATYITQYIHLNPVGLFQAKPRTDGDDLLSEVEKYQWSTLPDYLGKGGKLSILLSQKDKLSFRNKILGVDAKQYQEFLRELFVGLS